MANQRKCVAPQHEDSALPPSRRGRAEFSGGAVGSAAGFDSEWVPAWLRPTGPEHRLPVVASIVVAIALQIWLSDRFGLHPRWLLPLLEIALLGVLTAINPVRLSRRTRIGRYLTMTLAGAITLDNVVSAREVVDGAAERHCPVDHRAGPCARSQHPEMKWAA